MSAQRLSYRKIRRLRRVTGLDITRAWAFGGYTYSLYIPGPGGTHFHGWFNQKTGECGMEPPSTEQMHYTSCNLSDEDAGWDARRLA